jgi:GNAT superfamily N-acetyltransferase
MGQAELALRLENTEDQIFLRRLYCAIRWPELAPLPWSDAQKSTFLLQQFVLQHLQYETNYRHAEFNVIELNHEPVGRLYLDRGESEHRIVDISLLPERSGGGIGSTMLDRLIDEARVLQKTLSIHVDALNPARRLYVRKGFCDVEQRGPYWLMELRF